MKAKFVEDLKKIAVLLCLVPMVGLTSCNDDEEDTPDPDPLVTYNSEDFYNDYNASNLFEDSDMNGDNSWDNNEFDDNAFNMWDTNDNGTIEQNELTTATTDFRVSNTDWASWDTNTDNSLDMEEFRAGYMTSDFYNTWDADANATLSEREFTDGIFSRLDADGDGEMSEEDYNTYNDRWFGF